MRGTLDFSGSEHRIPIIFCQPQLDMLFVYGTSKQDCQCPLLYLKNYSNLLFKYNPYKENFLVEEYDKRDGAYIQREKKLTKLPESTQWTIIHL